MQRKNLSRKKLRPILLPPVWQTIRQIGHFRKYMWGCVNGPKQRKKLFQQLYVRKRESIQSFESINQLPIKLSAPQ